MRTSSSFQAKKATDMYSPRLLCLGQKLNLSVIVRVSISLIQYMTVQGTCSWAVCTDTGGGHHYFEPLCLSPREIAPFPPGGGGGGMFFQKSLKSRGFEMQFQHCGYQIKCYFWPNFITGAQDREALYCCHLSVVSFVTLGRGLLDFVSLLCFYSTQ